MDKNNFWVDLVASLKREQSRKQLESDAKNFVDIKVPLTGTLDKDRTRAQLQQDIKSLNGTIDINGKVNSKGIANSVKESVKEAQNIAKNNPVKLDANFDLKKSKLLSDIRYFGQQNSKMFKDANMSAKYNTLLDNAKLATSSKQIQNLRLQLSAMRSEIKATHLSGLTLGDTFKKTFKRATELFTGTGGVMLLYQQMRQAWTEALNLDKAYTDLIKVQNELSRSDYPDYLERCNKKAQELASTQKGLIEGATEFSKSGYDLTTSNKLTEKSTILANVGDMSASDSAKAIISGVQAYDTIDGYDDVIGKATTLIDKYNEIGNTASITTAEIAQGVEKVGAVFSDANTSVDEFIALLAAGNRQYQDANSLALGLRTAALRIRGATAELKQMGEETEGVYTSASNLQKKIEGLTNVDGKGGVKILEADQKTYRSIYDIFLDISKVYQQMSDVDQSALLELIAGKHRASAISAALNNMSEATEIYERSLNSAGSAQREYDKYLESSQASLNRFKATMTETYQSVIDGSTVKGILNCGNATLQFLNSLGLVESTLKGFVAIGVVKVITTLSTAFKASAIQASNFGQALKMASNIPDGNLASKYNTLKSIAVASKTLTEAQLKQVLSNKALSDSDRIRILRLSGLEKSAAQAKLAQMGLIQSTQRQNAANASATASTFSFSSAVKGLGLNLKMAFMSNPVGISVMALSTIFGVVTSKISEYNEKVKETRQANIDAATSAKEKADTLRDLYVQYENLNNISNKSSAQEEQFKQVVNDITKALGDKAQALNGLVKGQDEYTKSLENATKAEMESQYATAKIGAKAAEDELKSKTYENFLGSKNSKITIAKNEGLNTDEQQAALEVVKEILYEYETINKLNAKMGTIWQPVDWDTNKSDMGAVVEYYNALVEAREKLATSDNADLLMSSDVYKSIDTVINNLSDSVEKYTEQEYNALKLNYEWQNGIPSTEEEFRKMEKAILSTSGVGERFQEVLRGYLSEDFSSLSNSIDKIKNSVDGVAKSTSNAKQSLSDWLNASQGGSESGSNTNSKLIDDYVAKVDKAKEKLSSLTSITKDDLYELSKEFSDSSFLNIDIETPEGLEELRKKLSEIANGECQYLENALKNVEDSTEKQSLLNYIRDVRDEVSNLTKTVNGVDPTILSKSLKDITKQDVIKALDDISASMNALDSAYAEFKDKDTKNFSLDSLKSLQEQFGNLDGFDDIISKMDKVKSSSAEIQKAFDDLATAYVNQSGILTTVNKDTADLAVQQLKEMGVANAETVVQQALEYNMRKLSDAKEAAKEAGIDLENVTVEEIAQLISEKKVSLEAATALGEFALKKQLANRNTISTSADITNLVRVATAAGIAVNALSEYQTYKSKMSSFSSNASKNLKKTMSGGGFDFDKAKYEKGAVDSSKENLVDAIDKAYKSKYADESNILSQISSINYTGGAKTKSTVDKNDKNKKTAEKFNENIDWAAQSISVLTANLQKLQSELDNTSGYEKQIAKLNEIYKTNQNLTKSYKTNYQAYNNYYNKLKNKYKDVYKQYGAKIENGETFSIENFKGKSRKKTYNQIQKLIEAYNNKTGAKNDYENQKSSEKQSYIDLYQKMSDHQNDIIETKKIQLENTNSYSKQKKLIDGIMSATAKKLEYDLKIADTQIEKNKLLQEYISSMQELAKSKVDNYWEKKDKKVQKYEDTNEVLNATMENTTGADNKNKILDQVLSNEKNALKQSRSNVKTAKSEKDKVYEKIDSKYKKNVDEDGKIVTNNIKNISDAQAKYIAQYNAWIDSLAERENELAIKEQDYIKAKADTVVNKANNFVEDADNQISLIEDRQRKLENYKTLTEAKGNTVAKAYYEDQANYEQQSLKHNKELKARLEKQLETLKAGSKEWYQVYAMISNCDDEIAKSVINTQNFANAIREIDLSVFENLKDEFETLTGEANFLIELLSDSDMTKSLDNIDIKQAIKNGDFESIKNIFNGSEFGNLTEEGMATVALHGQNYNTYMNEAYEIQKKRNELAKEMAEDESKNTEENRKQLKEYDSAIQSTILNAKKEGKSAIDIVKQGLTDEINLAKQIVDQKKEALNKEKELYEYQKNVKKQTKDIASLQQQYDAWSKIDTEEGKNKAQRLKVQLEDANTSLEETVYYRYLSDQEEILDEFGSDFENMISNYLKDTNPLLSDILNAVNNNEDGIKLTLDDLANNWGITLSDALKSVFNTSDSKNALDTNPNASTVPDTTTGTGSASQKFVDNSNNEQEKKETEYRNTIEKPTTVTPENVEDNSPNIEKDDYDDPSKDEKYITTDELNAIFKDKVINDKNSELKSSSDTSKKEETSSGVSKPLTFSPDKAKIKKYINSKASKTDTDRKKLSDLNRYIYDKTKGKILSKKEISVLGNKYLDVKTSDNPTSKQKTAILKALKKSGYSKGGFAEDINKVVKSNGDDGIATIQRKELVLTKVQTNDYMKLMDNIDNLNNMFDYSSMVKDFQNNIQKTNTNTTNQISAEFHFNLPNVTDTNSFLKAIQNDSNVQRAIQNVTVGRLGGSGKLSVNKIR